MDKIAVVIARTGWVGTLPVPGGGWSAITSGWLVLWVHEIWVDLELVRVHREREIAPLR